MPFCSSAVLLTPSRIGPCIGKNTRYRPVPTQHIADLSRCCGCHCLDKRLAETSRLMRELKAFEANLSSLRCQSRLYPPCIGCDAGDAVAHTLCVGDCAAATRLDPRTGASAPSPLAGCTCTQHADCCSAPTGQILCNGGPLWLPSSRLLSIREGRRPRFVAATVRSPKS